jgi:hypothetical protein
MVSKEGTVNLSNMPAKSEQPSTEFYVENKSLGQYTGLETSDGGWKVTKFETTPLISSYLVAYANGPFECIEGSYTSPISGKVRPVRVYGAFRLSLARHCTDSPHVATKEIIHQTKVASHPKPLIYFLILSVRTRCKCPLPISLRVIV